MAGPFAYVTGNATDLGRVREENQDYYGAYPGTPYGDLWVVCDGMGGASGGRTASTMAVEAVRKTLAQVGEPTGVQALLAAVAAANAAVYARAMAEAALRGMGTTIVMLLISEARAYLAHVGDSRAYLLRDGQLRQVTRDHTIVREMVESGVLTPEQARTHPDSHIISRSVGIGPRVAVDVESEGIEVRLGDRWILCTDGLSGPVDDATIAAVAAGRTPHGASQALVECANEAGGPDNITVQIVEVVEGAPAAAGRAAGWLRVRPMSRRAAVAVLVVLALVALGLLVAVSGGPEPDSPRDTPPAVESVGTESG